MPFKTITASEQEAFVSGLRSGQYNLLLGAGTSMDSHNAFGNYPTGEALKVELCALKKTSNKYSLQKVFDLLSESEIKSHITDRFLGGTPGETAKLISSFLWKRAFTWNIDDVIESAYKLPGSKQRLESLHFNSDYQEFLDLSTLIYVHLHGSALTPEAGYVFSREQYLKQITKINPWMTMLSQFMQGEPFIIAGTALDEIDLDFYLAQRSSLTSRDDRAPSIIVASEDDEVSAHICKEHDLLHFIGRPKDFFQYCKALVPQTPTPEELVPLEARKLLPAGVGRAAAMSFYSDFEIVPSSAKKPPSSRFLYGHAPTWGDLEGDNDVSRQVSATIIQDVKKRLEDAKLPRIALVTEAAGAGKTTILRRVAFELSRSGIRTVMCSALSRISNATASTIDLIDEPLVIVVDNLADQATAIAEMLARLEKPDVVVLAAERNYRLGYIKQVMAGLPFAAWDHLNLTTIEAERLIDRYADDGLIGDHRVLKNRREYAERIRGEEIAVACCRIMNDFRPLDRIVDGIINDAGKADLDRYLCAALAQHCFNGGVRYEVLVGATKALGLKQQLEQDSPLPLGFFDARMEFVIPENAVLAERVLTQVARDDTDRLLAVFVNLAREIRPRINRQAIRRRTPEARLSGRLFDYDDIAGKFLGDKAAEFYRQTKSVWQWNSRYWEQVALLNLAQYHRYSSTQDGIDALGQAVLHARHAVSIELHPFGLTTLGKILMTQMLISGSDMTAVFSEAFEKLAKAIDLEAQWSRSAIQPYMSLFSGTHRFLERGGNLSNRQQDTLLAIGEAARSRFPRDTDMQQLLGEITAKAF
jgi:hypothetical protein